MSKGVLLFCFNTETCEYHRIAERCVELIKKNYMFAVTTKRSRYKTNTFEETQIPRVPINSNTSIYKFLIKILTFYEDIKFKK